MLSASVPLAAEQVARLRELVAARLAEHCVLRIRRSVGLFEARAPKR